ncbi:MAG: SDR family NAD(P)-dependent oxidoreductase [Planctomycetes bacterium]|nr:SDR family NAD(P)-dependent oxidoreductase [Planctomycetota bacterium]NOG54283.1 SDR family NAD(P)-dependent oxidoreductase [Planctomycetota bacterium]
MTTGNIKNHPDLAIAAYAGRPVLVTGGAGFIGSHLATRLVALGAHVTVIDDLSEGRADNLRHIRDQIRFVHASILDADALADAVEGKDLVFHEAALASVPRSVAEPERTNEVNVIGTLRVLQACVNHDVPRLVYASSSSVYGDLPTLPKHESHVPQPLSPYAQQKLSGEHMCSVWSACYGLTTVSLRYFNVFGPRQAADSAYAAVVAAFATALLAGEQPRIYGDGSASRDFTYIDNVVNANLAAGSCDPTLSGRVFNIAMGQRITVLELLQEMATLTGRPADVDFLPPREGDVEHSLADIEAARNELGFQPTVALREGLHHTLQWYESQRNGT